MDWDLKLYELIHYWLIPGQYELTSRIDLHVCLLLYPGDGRKFRCSD